MVKHPLTISDHLHGNCEKLPIPGTSVAHLEPMFKFTFILSLCILPPLQLKWQMVLRQQGPVFLSADADSSLFIKDPILRLSLWHFINCLSASSYFSISASEVFGSVSKGLVGCATLKRQCSHCELSCLILSGTRHTALGTILRVAQHILCKTIKSSAAELTCNKHVNHQSIDQSLFV